MSKINDFQYTSSPNKDALIYIVSGSRDYHTKLSDVYKQQIADNEADVTGLIAPDTTLSIPLGFISKKVYKLDYHLTRGEKFQCGEMTILSTSTVNNVMKITNVISYPDTDFTDLGVTFNISFDAGKINLNVISDNSDENVVNLTIKNRFF